MSGLIPILPEPDQPSPLGLPPAAPPVVIPEPAPAPEPSPPGGGEGEPAPAPPVAPGDTPGESETLPGLDKLAWLIVLLGLIALAAVLVDALNKFLRWSLGPLFKRTGQRQMSATQWTQILSNSLGSAYSGLEADLGQSFHRLGQTTTSTGALLVRVGQAVRTMANRVVALEQHTGVQDQRISRTRQRVETVQHTADQATRDTLREQRRARATDANLQAQLQQLPAHITQLIEPELEALRHRIRELERGATATWDEVKQHGEAIGEAGAVAAVAAGLAGLGSSWIRCEANKLLGEAMCEQGPQNMKRWLDLLLAGGILLDLKQYVKLEQTLVRPVTDTITTLLRAEP